MPKTEAFDQYINEYDNWFDVNKYVFHSELNAVKKVFPRSRDAIEAGIGSGVFAVPLGIKEGVEPSKEMRKRAERKGLEPTNGVAEDLPYADNSKEVDLMITTIYLN